MGTMMEEEGMKAWWRKRKKAEVKWEEELRIKNQSESVHLLEVDLNELSLKERKRSFSVGELLVV